MSEVWLSPDEMLGPKRPQCLRWRLGRLRPALPSTLEALEGSAALATHERPNYLI